jgi:hypothetical protein
MERWWRGGGEVVERCVVRSPGRYALLEWSESESAGGEARRRRERGIASIEATSDYSNEGEASTRYHHSLNAA